MSSPKTRDPKTIRKELRETVRDLLEYSFRAGNRTLSEDERSEARVGVAYLADEARGLIDEIER